MKLSEILQAHIKENGPISAAEYMALCLTHPHHGYYTARDPLGRKGDFTTAPEISQLFGEMVAVWLLSAWERIGAPAAFTLLEPGPGRGTLMADVLRVTRKYPAFGNAARIVLVETSPVLRERQRAALADYAVTWHDALPELEPIPLLTAANEFFDALPIRQFEFHQGVWRERLVGLAHGGTLQWRLSQEVADHPLLPAGGAEGDIREVSDVGRRIASDLSRHINAYGGAALWIDYGHGGGVGDTLQAVKAHAYHPVLEDPGEADLTAHVNFTHLADAAREAGCTPEPLITQREFLMGHGIFERAARLLASASPSQKKTLLSGLDRLTSPEAMGTLFKVLQVYGNA